MAIGGGKTMGGLLGNELDDPRTQGVLALASGLLAAGGPQVGRPVSLGQALGSGLQMGQQAFNKAQARADLLAKQKADDEYRSRQEARLGRLDERQLLLDEENRARLARLDKRDAMKDRFQVVGGNLFEMTDAGPKLVETPGKLKETASSDGRLIYSTDADGKVTVRKSGLFDELEKAAANAKGPAKLSGTLQKVEDEDFEAINTSQFILEDTDEFIDLIDSGDLDFAFGDGFGDSIALAVGTAGEEVQNRQEFNIFLQRLRNATLRLNKGTQTEGDAERALREIVDNKNNTEAVRRALSELREVNERAIDAKKRGINRRRKSQGVDAVDFSEALPAASTSNVGFKEVD